MKNSWNVTDGNGVSHTIERKSGFTGNKIIVDGYTYKAKSGNWLINVIDYQIQFPGIDCNVVVIGNKADLAVNGVYIGSQKKYEPIRNIPAWLWVLVAVSVLGGWFFGGILCMALGCGDSVIFVKEYLERKNGMIWVVFAIFAVFTAVMFYLQIIYMMPLVR